LWETQAVFLTSFLLFVSTIGKIAGVNDGVGQQTAGRGKNLKNAALITHQTAIFAVRPQHIFDTLYQESWFRIIAITHFRAFVEIKIKMVLQPSHFENRRLQHHFSLTLAGDKAFEFKFSIFL